MLYVVAWPILSETDDTALRRIRAQYHAGEADLIGPHFTLVFGAPPERERSLHAALEQVQQRPFWFLLDRVVRLDQRPPSRSAYLYAVPSEGASALAGLHEALNPVPGDEDFEPHITLGLFQRSADAEQVARVIERQHLPMHGRIEELSLLRHQGDALETIKQVRLAG
ncbi:2'-5' RNA ligase [Enhydrobacter aerosaccus]|uniref:2'-5' RNA ligase n=1 Tax=Enhydrobacter aerosaccus TaxID=225324 RepID=A0A1T4RZ80_9HYPH|nr:2'-5' RNA ligase family protein [Enhydrobacter aerosaccus]SKA21272.1 2'-5' RNA ligase [Enhydrobacter aerosaccus]